MDAPLSVYMDFLAIYVKFRLNKVLFSSMRGRIVSMGAEKYDWTIILNTFYGQKSTSTPQGRAEQAQGDRQKNGRNLVHEHRVGEEMMEINGGDDANEEIINI